MLVILTSFVQKVYSLLFHSVQHFCACTTQILMFTYLLFRITKENTHIGMCLKDSYQD